jgi:hypothetical protein
VRLEGSSWVRELAWLGANVALLFTGLSVLSERPDRLWLCPVFGLVVVPAVLAFTRRWARETLVLTPEGIEALAHLEYIPAYGTLGSVLVLDAPGGETRLESPSPRAVAEAGSGPAYERPLRFAAGASPPAPPGLLEILPVFLVTRSSLAGRRDADPIR